METVGIIASLHKRNTLVAAKQVVTWLRRHKTPVLLRADLAKRLQQPDLARDEETLVADASVIISLGGDGTVLHVARLAAPLGKPILAINAGGLGFLTEVGPPQVLTALRRMLDGKYQVVERMMIGVEVIRRGEVFRTLYGLNDAVVTKGAFSRLLRLHTHVGERELGGFSGDGAIVATPTGSTAYSLSAGGPVVDPELRVLVLTPVCPHALSLRPVVVPATETVTISIAPVGPNQQVMITVDGQVGFELQGRDQVRVSAAPFSARLMTIAKHEFYPRLHTKLKWGA
jgi:NAD+ kinase